MIRAATRADAAAMGEMHARSWAETYPGLVPQALFEEMTDPMRRGAAWARTLAQPLLPDGVWLAEEQGVLLGFIAVCRARTAALGTQGEVSGLYVLRQAQGRGLGRALLAQGARILLACGCADAGAWALDGNEPARAFYRATGAIEGRSQIDQRGETSLAETAFLWGDLRALLR